MRNFTPEDLLEYHYGDMSGENRKELRKALKENWSLKEKMEVIREAAERLEKSTVAPREEAVSAVLKYAAAHLSATI